VELKQYIFAWFFKVITLQMERGLRWFSSADKTDSYYKIRFIRVAKHPRSIFYLLYYYQITEKII